MRIKLYFFKRMMESTSIKRRMVKILTSNEGKLGNIEFFDSLSLIEQQRFLAQFSHVKDDIPVLIIDRLAKREILLSTHHLSILGRGILYQYLLGELHEIGDDELEKDYTMLLNFRDSALIKVYVEDAFAYQGLQNIFLFYQRINKDRAKL